VELRAGSRAWGFTLIELMVVVVIATILLSIAIPSYMSQIRESRRTEAKTALLALAGREESYFSTNGSSYTAVATSLGYTAFGAANPIGGGYYFLTVCSPACAPSAAPPPSYTVTAIPVGTQVNDTQCASFSVDSTGKQYAVNSAGADATPYCWGN
jgi:type IV pilus assembly protein PilE